jgi:hypothetical protein
MPPGTAPGVVNIMLSIQVVKQVNFGPLESKRYFVQCIDGDDKFIEVIEQWLIDVNIEKLNMYVVLHGIMTGNACTDSMAGSRTTNATCITSSLKSKSTKKIRLMRIVSVRTLPGRLLQSIGERCVYWSGYLIDVVWETWKY